MNARLTLLLIVSEGLCGFGFAQEPAQTYHYAVEDISTANAIRRGVTTSQGIANGGLILASDTKYRLWQYNSATGLVGQVDFTTPSAGIAFTVPPVPSRRTLTGDKDFDGLSNEIEFILGTSPTVADTDGDGVPDGAEIKNGTNPLDGLAARTGLVNSVDLPGTSVDVMAFNNVAVVANSGAGISVFNVFNRMSPTIIATVDTPGNATAVAYAGGNRIAVADGAAGVAIVDITDPPAARIIAQRQLFGDATCVTIQAGLALVGTSSGQIAVVDTADGEVLASSTPFPDMVHDLAWSGDRLFALSPGRLTAFRLNGTLLEQVGQITGVPGFAAGVGRHRLAVGGGVAYVPYTTGFRTYNVSNPAAMTLLGDHNNSPSQGWKQILPNGSGLGLAVVGPAPNADLAYNVSLYNLADPASLNGKFLTEFPTPGRAHAVTIYNGLGYVADGGSGLQVLNYANTDVGGVPPTITLITSAVNAQVEEGQILRLAATAADDVQVRNVEFYLDGQLIVTDGGFPFEHAFTTPLIEGRPSPVIKLRARASDTTGNTAFSSEISLTLTADVTPPTIKRSVPDLGGVIGQVDTLIIDFSEPINPATATPAAVALRSFGPDGVPGNADDILLSSFTVEFRPATNSLTIKLPALLAAGGYDLRISSAITDTRGNALAPRAGFFTVLPGIDTDRDGLPDSAEAALGTNPLLADTDHDGILDGKEDNDGDQLTNAYELLLGTSLTNADSNGNGTPDRNEDPDGDLLTNLREYALATNPMRADTDQDGWSDSVELDGDSDPLDSTKKDVFGKGLASTSGPGVSVLRFAVDGGTGLVSATSGETRVLRFAPDGAANIIIATPQPKAIRQP